MSEHIRSSVQGGIAAVLIDRPEKKNSLTRPMYLALADAITRADADRSVRVVTLAGNGGSFCAGNDIGDFGATLAPGEPHPSTIFLEALHAIRKPVVAAVQGWAVGIGATLLLHCDLVYASEDARLLFPFVNLGLTPEAGSSAILPRMMGRQRAAEAVLLAEPLPAAKARDYGLVNEVLAADALAARVREVAEKLAAKPPQALRASRELLLGSADDIESLMRREEEIFKQHMVSEEAAEAFAAFAEKRSPDFSRFD